MKYVIYQHGARGYGRIARSIKFTNVLNDIEDSSGVIFSGDDLIKDFCLPKNLEILKIPPIYKGLNKNYTSVNSQLPIEETLKLRTKIIKKTIINFKPDIFFIDTIPTGVLDELKEILIWIKKSDCKTRIVFIVRDILDSPTKTILEWTKFDVYKVLEKYYDLIFVFGSETIFNFYDQYKLPNNLDEKLIYCNYFSSNYISRSSNHTISEIDILITVGGGIDGFKIISTFLNIYKKEKWSYKVLIILGQQFPNENKLNIVENLPPNIETIDFTTSIYTYYQNSKLIICMGGYNTITEILSLKKYPLVIPRRKPTLEQLIRAKLLSNLSLISMVNIEDKIKFTNMVLSNLSLNHPSSQQLIFNLKEIVEINIKKLLND